ncbi:sensor histidine kinase [Mucilaginibacter phyllosphaerae]
MSEKIERELEKILEFSRDMICLIDANGVFLRVSAASYAILGYRPEEMVSHSYQHFLHPDDLKVSQAAIKEVTETGTCRVENRYRHKNKDYVPLIWSSSWDRESQIMHCIARDGRAKQELNTLVQSLEETNQRYDYVTRATSDAIWDWDLITNSLYWGEGLATIFGYRLNTERTAVDSWPIQIHPDDMERVLAGIHRVIESAENNWKDEYLYRRADGSYADVVNRGFVIRNAEGKGIRMVGAMHDISERKASLRQLKQLTDDLYSRNRELQHFGYIVSHNLRSPVANIMGLTNILELAADDPELLNRCTIDLKASIIQLDEVIKDMSKILSVTDGTDELTLEQVDIVDVLNKVCIALKDQILNTKAEISIPRKPYIISSHKAYLYSTFFNLISNALKYRSDQPPVVNVAINQSGKELVIEISDNGIGIDVEKYSEDLFKPYKRFNYTKEGKGLGLFLVKSHLTALKGRIELYSELGHGTKFKLYIPV